MNCGPISTSTFRFTCLPTGTEAVFLRRRLRLLPNRWMILDSSISLLVSVVSGCRRRLMFPAGSKSEMLRTWSAGSIVTSLQNSGSKIPRSAAGIISTAWNSVSTITIFIATGFCCHPISRSKEEWLSMEWSKVRGDGSWRWVYRTEATSFDAAIKHALENTGKRSKLDTGAGIRVEAPPDAA